MSEPIVEPTTPAQGEAEPQPTEPTATPTAPEVDWKAKSREWEKRAKENKAAADRLAELEESQKTEAQKLADRLAAAEQRAAAAETKVERARIAAEKGVPADLLVGDTTEALEAFADQLVAFRGEAQKLPVAPPATGQGRVGVPIAPADIDTQITEAQRAGNVTLAMRLTNQKLVALANERNLP